ncbi:hypothetical protein CAter282_0237 [Collimonas arenae]|uniref:Uncharacterized protein n=1 Tax=Collimonas arenae TaxID=279058 RepID=A0A127PK53_9BURK|nr:hypothetical protein CAter10_0250 [Collimonas arenae]AMP08059.1 hypothetical protein CAter282_0237 [Collimonas arenae]
MGAVGLPRSAPGLLRSRFVDFVKMTISDLGESTKMGIKCFLIEKELSLLVCV